MMTPAGPEGSGARSGLVAARASAVAYLTVSLEMSVRSVKTCHSVVNDRLQPVCELLIFRRRGDARMVGPKRRLFSRSVHFLCCCFRVTPEAFAQIVKR